MPIAEFGNLVTEVDVDVALLKTLRRWLPTYLSNFEVERELPPHLLARPKPESFQNTLEDDEFPDARLPAIVVTTANTPEAHQQQQGKYRAIYQSVISTVVRGRTPEETRALAAMFSGVVRQVVLQQQQLDGFSAECKWRRANVAPVADVTDEGGRYLAAGINEFMVHVDDVVDSHAGPLDPGGVYEPPDEGEPDTPFDPLASVTAVTIALTAKSGDDD